jgi:hypothetical protein
MELWKAWSDISRRFYLCVLLVTLMAAPVTIRSAVQSARGATTAGEIAEPGHGPATEAPGGPFELLVTGWIHGDSYYVFAILAVVLGVGGTMTLGNAHSNLMTLSLPERRRRWLGAQWIVVSALVFLLVIWEALIFVLAGVIAGLSVPVGSLLVATLLTAFAAALWISPSMLSTALTRDAVRAALVVVAVIVALQTIRALTGLADWSLRHIADVRAWDGAVPWKSLLAGGALALASAFLVMRRFDRTDY